MIRPIEYWKKIDENIAGFDIEDWYWISTEGRIYSSISNKILKTSMDRDGYENIGLYIKSTRVQKNFRVHRLVMKAFHDIDNSNDLQVNHINGIKNENNEFNLEWCTPSQNIIHAFNIGLKHGALGEDNPASKITSDQADTIGQLLASEKYTYKEISNIVGCSKAIIFSIKSGKAWRSVYDKYLLSEKIIPNNNRLFSTDEIMFICNYFESNNITELDKDIKIDILRLLNKEDNYNNRKMISRIFRKERHTNISSNYNF